MKNISTQIRDGAAEDAAQRISSRTNRCYFTCEGEESALPLVIEQFGDECMMYASDYPHWDMEWPHSVSQVVGRKDISDQTKQRILADNAKNFLPVLLIMIACHRSRSKS